MDNLTAMAKELGFSHASLIDTAEIPFEPSFRTYCEANVCGQYGANWSCPPTCGTPAELEARIKAYPKALVLQTLWEVDYHDLAALKQAKLAHDHMSRALMDRCADRTRGFLVGASGCSLCEVCTLREGMPCRFPEQRVSCMSAYCIYVKALAERCDMVYDSGAGTVNFFGMYVFGET